MALRSHEPRTAVEDVVGVCEDISEIQCGGQGGQDEIKPGTSPNNPISALSVMMDTDDSGATSRMWWLTHSALRQSPRMVMLVMRAHR